MPAWPTDLLSYPSLNPRPTSSLTPLTRRTFAHDTERESCRHSASLIKITVVCYTHLTTWRTGSIWLRVQRRARLTGTTVTTAQPVVLPMRGDVVHQVCVSYNHRDQCLRLGALLVSGKPFRILAVALILDEKDI